MGKPLAITCKIPTEKDHSPKITPWGLFRAEKNEELGGRGANTMGQHNRIISQAYKQLSSADLEALHARVKALNENPPDNDTTSVGRIAIQQA